MGIKSTDVSNNEKTSSDVKLMQQKAFEAMDKEYELARMTTHTHRGQGLGFASAGFPGADKEYEMVKEFFMPIKPKVVVDMSCATGTFFSIQELIFFC